MEGIKNKIREKWYLRWLLFLSNWIAQGILNADKTEKAYKISFTVIFSIITFLVLNYALNSSLGIKALLAFLIAHSLNWFVNGSISTILLHRLFIGTLSKEKAFDYLQDIQNRLERIDSISTVAVFGSIARGEMKPSSDIDITFVRKPGFRNAIKSTWFMVLEKLRTNTQLIPIEPFLADTISYMKFRYKPSETPIILKGDPKVLKEFYVLTQTLEQAANKNNVNLKDA